MMKNIEKGNEALKELEQEMTERFFVAGKRLWMNFITWLDETWVGSAVGVIRDGVVMIADLFEGGALKKEWNQMLADQEKFFQGLGGDIIDVDDLGRLKQMLEFAKRAGYTGEWVMKIKEKVVELEEKSLRITNEQTRAEAERAQLEKEAAAKGLEGAELEKWRLEIRKRDIMEQKTSMGNAQQKLAILKEQLAKEKETQAYYDKWAAGREGDSRIVLEQNKKVRKLMGDIANIEKFITNEKEKQRKAIHKQIMEQAKATHKTTVSTMWADDPRHSDVGRMDILKQQLEAERDFKLQMAQLELQDVQNSLVATMEEKEAAERTWTEKKKMINAEADKQIANTELQIQKSQAQFMLQHKTSVWQGGGGMGSGMLGAHSNFLQKQKSEQEAYDAWEANQTDENRERYEAAKEERISGAVEVGRATVGAAADMMLQLAQQKKKYFKYYQMLSIAETVIATGQGVMQAYAQAGPYLGTVFAALITAMGAMKVAMIMKQKPPEYAQGGVFDARQQKRNRGAAYATGGVTSQAAYAMLGDNASGKELVIPAEHIDSDHTAGYTRDGGAPIIMNVVTSEDVAAAMEETAGRQVTVNTIGRDMRERRSTYRNVRDASKGRG